MLEAGDVKIAIENGHRKFVDLPIEHGGSFQFVMLAR